MLDITKILSGIEDRHSIRYSRDCSKTETGVKKGSGPVIAWNITRKCNYSCKHCYSNAIYGDDVDTLDLKEIYRIVDEFAANYVPVILLSGGEPLMREDIFDIMKYIKTKNIRTSLSTNGSLIDQSTAYRLKDMGISYVGISIDGTREKNDDFRGTTGAFDNALRAIENCHRVGQKVGLRFTLQKNNYKDVPTILNLMEEMKVDRICFYHLVPSGRGKEIMDQMLSNEETKEVIDYLYEYAKKAIVEGKGKKEILTVANHADGPYIYLKTRKEDPELADKMFEFLARNRGNRSGSAIANVDWKGNVYPDQFTRFLPIGNLKEKSFSDIWNNSEAILGELRNRKNLIKGRCTSCKWLSICNGNLRARAYYIHNDMWASDPACYLEDDEI